MKYVFGNIISMVLGALLAAIGFDLWQHDETKLGTAIFCFILILSVRLVVAHMNEEGK